MSEQTQAVANPNSTIKGLLQGPEFRAQVAAALPAHLKPERFIRVALTAMLKTPGLADCDKGSFFQALLNLSSFGLEPDGRHAHLIPFNNRKRGIVECQLILDYKGLVALAYRSGAISNIHADVVRENDVFEYNMGEVTAHKINFREPRGNIYAVYAVATFKDGTKKCEVMSCEEVESVRKRSRAGESGPWVTDWAEMAKKTVFRRLSKWLPFSPEFHDALEKDSDVIDVKAAPSVRSMDDLVDALGNDIAPEVEPEPQGDTA
jgi:recombination protein RecT